MARDLRAEQEVEWEGAGIPAEVAAAPTVAKPSEKVVITGERLRAWGWLSALSLVDQGLASGAGFAVSLLLARWMEPEVYGAFAVAFAGFLFVSGFHNVLLLEPMSVMGPSRHAARLPGYFRAQIAVHFILVGVLCGVSLRWRLDSLESDSAKPSAGRGAGGGLGAAISPAGVARAANVLRDAAALHGSAGEWTIFQWWLRDCLCSRITAGCGHSRHFC